MKFILEEELFTPLPEGEICVCKIGDEVNPMWGANCVTLTEEYITALFNGDCIWLTDGEYATILRMEQPKEGET